MWHLPSLMSSCHVTAAAGAAACGCECVPCSRPHANNDKCTPLPLLQLHWQQAPTHQAKFSASWAPHSLAARPRTPCCSTTQASRFSHEHQIDFWAGWLVCLHDA